MEQKELIDYVCETVLKPLSEERGRIPFIEKILNELETQLTEQMDSSKHGYYLDKFVFKPTQDTFFLMCAIFFVFEFIFYIFAS